MEVHSHGSEDVHKQEQKIKHKGKHDKPKPWDEDPTIDHWKINKFDPSWNPTGMLEISSFSTIFPKYREKYIQGIWPTIKSALYVHGIACDLNLVEGTMTVSTTRRTKDPYIIIKARDLIKLLSRSVPANQAVKILDDEMQCHIINIGNLVRNKARFVRRRQRLLGPNNATLRAIEIVTRCYILVQGNTVAVMGSFKGLKVVRRIVEECMENRLRPKYHIEIVMLKNELGKDADLVSENWDRFLPRFKNKNVKKKNKANEGNKKQKMYTPFPPPQQPSKIDRQLESGEYFLSERKKEVKEWQEKQEKLAEKTAENKRKREAAFVPPKEPLMQVHSASIDDNEDVNAMARLLKKKAKKYGKQETVDNVDLQAYIG